MLITKNDRVYEIDRDDFIEWIKDFILSENKRTITSYGKYLGNVEWNIDKIKNKADALFILELFIKEVEYKKFIDFYNSREEEKE